MWQQRVGARGTERPGLSLQYRKTGSLEQAGTCVAFLGKQILCILQCSCGRADCLTALEMYIILSAVRAPPFMSLPMGRETGTTSTSIKWRQRVTSATHGPQVSRLGQLLHLIQGMTSGALW